MYLSIPYHAGWSAYVDGKKTDIWQINTAYSGVNIIGEGEHKVELYYRPVCFSLGIILFMLGIIGSVLIEVLHRKKYKDV